MASPSDVCIELRVRSLKALSTLPESMLNVAGSMSTKTGLAQVPMLFAVAMKRMAYSDHLVAWLDSNRK